MGFFKKLKKAFRKVYQAPVKALGLKARKKSASGGPEPGEDSSERYAARQRVAGAGTVSYQEKQ